MASLHPFAAGGYAVLEGGFPYSQGTIALPGHRLVRVRFRRPPTIADGFEAIAAHLRSAGRPLTALCAAELRSPAPFTLDGFKDFNAGYVDVLRRWGLHHDGMNPVARSNVCPVHAPPAAPVFHAFCYTVADAAPGAPAEYAVAGSGEWPEDLPFPEGIVARGNVTAAGMSAKTAYVLRTMRERVAGLGGDWSRVTAAQVYTARDLAALIDGHFAASGLLPAGLTWHLCRPPIRELEFEMDLRNVGTERVID